MVPVVFLHFGGGGTYTAAFLVALTFVLIFVLSFAIGKLPAGTRRWSRAWLGQWVRAALPRLFVAGVFAAGLFLGSGLVGGNSGSDSGVCNSPLPPLGNPTLTGTRIAAAADEMSRISRAAAGGDLGAARRLFFGGDSHSVSHQIDPPLRNVDASAAKQLCRSVVALELQFASKGDAGVISSQAAVTAGILRSAGAQLSLDTPAPSSR